MTLEQRTLDLVAGCLDYPGQETAALARDAAARLASIEPELSSALFALAVFVEQAEYGEAEERYTALFDMSPVCTLHLGYHLFGEAYARGELLAGLAAELRTAGVSASGDLPDYLPSVLRLLGRLQSEEDRCSLRQLLLLPALVRMGQSLAQSKDPWSGLVRALPRALAEPGDSLEAAAPAARSDVFAVRSSCADAGCGHRSLGPGAAAGPDAASFDPPRDPSGPGAAPGPQQPLPW